MEYGGLFRKENYVKINQILAKVRYMDMTALCKQDACSVLNQRRTKGPTRMEYLLFGLGAAVCFLLFNHPDIMETARHAYILIQSTLDGDFLQFFENTLSRTYGFQYVNAAHYNIVMYILYALWELPLYLVERIGGFVFDDVFLAMWCKAIGVGFYLGCGILVGKLAQRIGCDETACQWASLLFWLNPISFFNTLVMGQYDSICLFFVLWAMLLYFDKKYMAFSLVMGVGFVFKFFPLFVFIPMLLLVEKRVPQLLKYGTVSLWLYIPTTLLFAGRTGDAAFFNQLMTDRLFTAVFPGGTADASYFGLAMVLICVAAYLYRPQDAQTWYDVTVYGVMTVFSLLFIFVLWHPQWLILLVPFLILSALRQREKTTYAYLNVALCIGFFLLVAFIYPHSLEGNLFDWGVLHPLTGWFYSIVAEPRWNAFYLALIPYLDKIAPILFYGALFCGILFQFPLHGKSLGDRLAGECADRIQYRLTCWGTFVLAFGGFWFAPTLFSYLKTIGLL